eukprot:88406-Pleurochrysis_carterae.AAC.1
MAQASVPLCGHSSLRLLYDGVKMYHYLVAQLTNVIDADDSDKHERIMQMRDNRLSDNCMAPIAAVFTASALLSSRRCVAVVIVCAASP